MLLQRGRQVCPKVEGTAVGRDGERGQALLLFAIVAPLILMVLALVLDVGWAYYMNKRAQTAADAAAMAGIFDARERLQLGGQAVCGTLGCQASGACPDSGNLKAACQYATVNGFTQGGDFGRQSVQVAADASPNPPGVPNIPVKYWVQVTARQSLGQWFSGMIANSGLSPAAQATAALREAPLSASLYLLNRPSDCFAGALNLGVVCGEDLLSLGWNTINASGGIYMSSSNSTGIGLPNVPAGTLVGNIDVTAPFTRLVGNGGIKPLLGLGSMNWSTPPVNGFPDGEMFSDPMAGKAQPPAPTGLPDHPVPGGVIVGSLLSGLPTVLPPGNYYATAPLLGATGLPITITGNVVFSDGQANPCGGFCNYVFYGGVVTGALSTVSFSPGRYVFAGAQPVAGGPGVGLTVGINSVVKDRTPLLSSGDIGQNSDAGEIFIFTDSNYTGLTLPLDLQHAGLTFPMARAGVTAGVNPRITLHGLNKNSSALPAELKPYAPVVIWQDRANTTLKYTPFGKLDLSCGGPCTNVLSVPGSQEMIIQASTNGTHAGTNLYGTIYGPRGSWLTLAGLLASDKVAGPLQIITGALQMTLNVKLDMDSLPEPPTILRASLIR